MSQPIGIAAGPKPPGEGSGLGTSPTQRKFLDVVDLSSSGYEVKIAEDNVSEVYVKLDVDPVRSPQLNLSADLCPYVGGVWWLRIELPERYPQASPSVGFVNRIFHPNVEEQSGSICLDVLNQTWSPMYTLSHALSSFLAQLLCYPNPHDPMNGEAAALLLQSEAGFKEKVRAHTATYATNAKANEAIAAETEGRDFYTPEAPKRRRKASDEGPGSAPGTEGSSFDALPQKKAAVDDDVSSVSDIDLE